MLRFLRIIGIVVFACLIGFSANSLWQMHETGELLEQYNSAPKADLTLLIFSVIALSALGYFEISRVRRLSQRRGYGESRIRKETEKEVDGLDSTSIYATPQTDNVWKIRRSRSSRSPRAARIPHRKQKQRGEAGMIWMRFLQLICVVLPVIYLVLLSLNLMSAHEDAWIALLLPVAFGILFILSTVATVGIFGKKTWGMMLGYALAVCNLLIFPYGTAVGLILMMALVGASAVFELSAVSDRRKKARRKSAKRTQYSAT